MIISIDLGEEQNENTLTKEVLNNLGFELEDSKLTKNNMEVTHLTIPEEYNSDGNTYKITKIDKGIFSFCNSLTSVTIPNTVIEIGDRAFSYCKNLTTVNISNSVTKIGKNAFYRCKNLNDITIPKNAEIDSSSFLYCGFTKDISDTIMKMKNKNNNMFNLVYSICGIYIFVSIIIMIMMKYFPSILVKLNDPMGLLIKLCIFFVITIVILTVTSIIKKKLTQKQQILIKEIIEKRLSNYYTF